MFVFGELASALPDPGDPNSIGLAAVVGGFLGAGLARLAGYSWETSERVAFRFAFVATGFALTAYLFGLSTGLY